jgi:hypothetical protein
MTQPFDLFDLATDPIMENQGVLTTLDGFGDTQWRIASTESDAYRGFMATAYKANKKFIDEEQAKSSEGQDSPELTALMQKLYLEAQARYILVGWEGTVPVKGKQLPYSYETALLLLSNIRKLREAVLLKANDFATFKAKRDWEDEKN